MKRLLFLSIILLLFVSSCTKGPHMYTLEDGCIGFQVKTYAVETRGTPIISASDMSNMGVIAYYTGNGDGNKWSNTGSTATPDFFNNVQVKNNNNVWSSTNKYYWPQAADAKCTFFAYAPYAATATNGISITNTTGTPSLTYTVPPICANQPDLMVATPRTDLNKTNTTGAIALTMKHALTCIGFKVQGRGENISKIAVKGVSVSGTLSLGGTAVSWSNLGTASNAEYTSGIKDGLTAGNAMVKAMNADGYLMMIPQTLDANAQLVITVNGTDKEISLSGQTWAPGQQIMYNLTIENEGVIITNGGITLIWAVGNLVADGKGGCKIGAPWDGGLYFQFGSLIGWSGGATGDGTGRGTDQINPTLRVAVNNTGSGPAVDSKEWVAIADETYWNGTGTVPFNPSGAIGDPCRHYLKGDWRLPTHIEMNALFGGNFAEEEVAKLSSIEKWSTEGQSVDGRTNYYAVYKEGTTTLKMPGGGARNRTTGALYQVGRCGYYWHGTANNRGGYYTGFDSKVSPFKASDRDYAYAVRCVRDVKK